MDPFSGLNSDPQSLHKYAYVHGNPVNAVDPTGNSEFSLVGVTATLGIVLIAISIGIQAGVAVFGGDDPELDAQFEGVSRVLNGIAFILFIPEILVLAATATVVVEVGLL